jgi:outer membrane autotransporter protein
MVISGLMCTAVAQAVDFAIPMDGKHDVLTERNHSFYVGFGFGPTQLKLANNERNVEGINFKFNASNNDLGGETHAGYWITDNVGIEVGGRSYGRMKAPFSFSDPHDNSTGSGESEVGMNGFNVSLVIGYDLAPQLQLFARAGVLMWKESYDSRFDIPGQPAIHRSYDQSGTGLSLGAGVSFRFADGWALQAQFEQASFGEDSVSMVSAGFSYDFIGWVR